MFNTPLALSFYPQRALLLRFDAINQHANHFITFQAACKGLPAFFAALPPFFTNAHGKIRASDEKAGFSRENLDRRPAQRV
jgi:hypothetical protein